jgi:outer membrane immunogenic protein
LSKFVLLLSAAAGCMPFLPLSAQAGSISADMPPVFTWTGFYGGQASGYTFSGDAAHPDGLLSTAVDAAGSAFATASGGPQQRSYLGGGQLGFNYQIQSLVFGLESDLTFTNLASATTPSALTNNATESVAYTSGVGSHWLSTVRGRFGTSVADHVLVYTTGGFAMAGRTFNNGAVVLSPEGQDFSIGTAARTASGIALGGGLEYALTKNWTLKGEYLYTELGRDRTIGSYNASIPIGGKTVLDEKIVRAAINYKFDWFANSGPAFNK